MRKTKRRSKGLMKKRKGWGACGFFALFLLFAALFSSLTLKAEAYSLEEYSLIDENTQGVLNDFIEIIPEGMEEVADPSGSADAVGMAFLLECIADTVNGKAGELTVFLLTLIGLSMLTSLASMKEGEIGKACRGSVSIVAAAVILDKMFALVDVIGESLADINEFYALVIPIVSSVNALGLSLGVASAQAAGMSLSLQIYSFLSGGFLYSFVGALTALGALSSIDGTSFGRIAQSVKKAFLWFVGIITAFMGATFSLQSLISSYADSTVMRGAKYAVAGMIPIVGSSISGALSVLASGFSYLKGAVGGGAIAIIITFAIAPLVTLLLYRAAFGIAMLFSDICLQDGSVGVLGAFSFAIDSLIAVYSLTMVIYIVQLAVFLKGGVALA